VAKTKNKRNGSIREHNEARILKAAEAVFANLHYYFRTKQRLYAGVLDNILEIWLDAMDEIQPGVAPADALKRYIARKMESSRLLPEPSRLWAMELISGARHVEPFLKRRLRRLVREKSAIIRGWIAAGKIDPIEPEHLLFMIWAMTQTYADFASQIAAVLGKRKLDEGVFAAATTTATAMVLKGLGARSGPVV
jgi:TetR/AcrR family transcriptional regulator